MVKEIFPTGFKNWTEYYQSQEKQEKKHIRLQDFACCCVFFGLIALDVITNIF